MSSMPGIDSTMSLLIHPCQASCVSRVARMVPLLLTAIVRTLTRAQATYCTPTCCCLINPSSDGVVFFNLDSSQDGSCSTVDMAIVFLWLLSGTPVPFYLFNLVRAIAHA
jgi:hypothetical protein